MGMLYAPEKKKAREKIVAIPFCPPLPAAVKISRPFYSVGASLSRAMPMLRLEIIQSGIPLDEKDYATLMFFYPLVYFVLVTPIMHLIISRVMPGMALIGALVAGLGVAVMAFTQISFYPKILVKKKVRELDKNLVHALRTILVEIKSGVSLFDAMKTVAEGDYGALSREFGKAVQEIQTGTPEKEAIEKLAEHNPSLRFRRALWQIINGMRAGADTAVVMRESVESLTREQAIEIRKYGSDLKTLSLVFMMMGVIIPALGITFLIVLTTFPQIKITDMYFWVLLAMVSTGELMFIGMIKSKRPTLIGD